MDFFGPSTIDGGAGGWQSGQTQGRSEGWTVGRTDGRADEWSCYSSSQLVFTSVANVCARHISKVSYMRLRIHTLYHDKRIQATRLASSAATINHS